MAADAIIYCLEHLTDYGQFERLCHDVLALDGFRALEPLGGFSDKGRDAIHRDPSSGTSTIFAYSVREDWRKKLEEDAAKVRSHGHKCDRFVFLCTSAFSATERDQVVDALRRDYGWTADIYGLERLAVMLRTTHKEVVANHPQIFSPPFFPVAGGLSLSTSRDHVLIDYADADIGLAHWLARRLTIDGYKVWCRGLAPLTGSSVGDSIRALLKSRACAYICIISQNSVADPDLTARRVMAHAIETGLGTFVLPALATSINAALLEEQTRRLAFARFDETWNTGLKHIEGALHAMQAPPAIRRRERAGSALVLSP